MDVLFWVGSSLEGIQAALLFANVGLLRKKYYRLENVLKFAGAAIRYTLFKPLLLTEQDFAVGNGLCFNFNTPTNIKL